MSISSLQEWLLDTSKLSMMSNTSNSFTTLKFEFYGTEVSCAFWRRPGYIACQTIWRNTESGCKKVGQLQDLEARRSDSSIFSSGQTLKVPTHSKLGGSASSCLGNVNVPGIKIVKFWSVGTSQFVAINQIGDTIIERWIRFALLLSCFETSSSMDLSAKSDVMEIKFQNQSSEVQLYFDFTLIYFLEWVVCYVVQMPFSKSP